MSTRQASRFGEHLVADATFLFIAAQSGYVDAWQGVRGKGEDERHVWDERWSRKGLPSEFKYSTEADRAARRSRYLGWQAADIASSPRNFIDAAIVPNVRYAWVVFFQSI
jgi:hypothetical protein